MCTMRGACLTFACTLVLLCQEALSRPGAIFSYENNEENRQLIFSEKHQHSLLEENGMNFLNKRENNYIREALLRTFKEWQLDTEKSAPRVKRQTREFDGDPDDDFPETNDFLEYGNTVLNENSAAKTTEHTLVRKRFALLTPELRKNDLSLPPARNNSGKTTNYTNSTKNSNKTSTSTTKPTGKVKVKTTAALLQLAPRNVVQYHVLSKNDSSNSSSTTKPSDGVPNNRKFAAQDNPPMTWHEMPKIIAYVGTLLEERVPEDTFIDDEQGNTPNLLLSLRHADRKAIIPFSHWLQFDQKEQTFYGLPSLSDVGVGQYVLVAKDRRKQKAQQIVNVRVMKAPPLYTQAAFHIQLENSFVEIAYNAMNKRKLIKKLAYIFGHENNTRIIRLASISDNPTTVKWYNTSLRSDTCPRREIDNMFDVISGNRKEEFNDSVERIFGEDLLKVVNIRMEPIDKCLDSGEEPREVFSIYYGVAAGEESHQGATGLVNLRVAERKLLSFVTPTFYLLLCMFTSCTIMYMTLAKYVMGTEFLPCIRAI